MPGKPIDMGLWDEAMGARTRRSRESPFEEDDAGKRDTQIPCAIPTCKGTVIEERTREYRGDPMRRIIGPGGKNQLTTIEELYCSRCGISYHHLPEVPQEGKD